MDSKHLLHDNPPAYTPPVGAQHAGAYGYGTIPASTNQPAFQSPSGYPYPSAPACGPPPPTFQPSSVPSTYTIIQQPATTSVVVVGGCPACRVGVLEDSFTCLGILCAILFFPIGILFCIALRQRRCPNCGATFG
ncbi:brain protein I3 [Protopterus annectens]|uniref:brain protein I3 n=1 Tax=Protopterus annectens TaxID=7888 RepID=UPI001CFBB6F7|nr:brain protein I3 [Protopterus annectens]